jgi:hypothetical protein
LIAVFVSAAVVLYILVPGGLFRLITSFAVPVKNQKTRTQEFTFAALFCLLPFLLALLLVWGNWPWPTNESIVQRRLAYRTVFTSLASDRQLDDAIQKKVYWQHVDSVLRRQWRFLVWYYFLVALEAWLVSWLAKEYRTNGKRYRDKVAKVVLRPSISEWAVLLTNFGSPKTDAHIQLDVLTMDGVLYQGKLGDRFFNAEGELAGVLLNGAARYDREQYSAHRQADLEAEIAKGPYEPERKITREKSTYWRLIPGADLFYIPRERIANINVRHVSSDIPKATEERLADRKITGFVISEQPPPPKPAS